MPQQTYRLLTVNTAPERAKMVVGRVADEFRARFGLDIEHVGNVDEIDQVESAVTQLQPDLLFTASMWTPAQSNHIIALARALVPDLITFAIPQGLQVARGPDGVVEYIREELPKVLL